MFTMVAVYGFKVRWWGGQRRSGAMQCRAGQTTNSPVSHRPAALPDAVLGQLHHASVLLWPGGVAQSGSRQGCRQGMSICWVPPSAALATLQQAAPSPWQVLMLLMSFMVDLRLCFWVAVAVWGEWIQQSLGCMQHATLLPSVRSPCQAAEP